MGTPDLSKLSALVVDDFSSFRSTIMGMLNKIGIKQIDEASRGQEAIKFCKERKFDLVLCDYNLGTGRNGQHLLEELRFRKWITRKTLFFMVTAEASKEMVLSAYDCEPDDYLMKPLNLRVLEQRITRLVAQREVLLPASNLLDQGAVDDAIASLESVVQQPGRHLHVAQKLLGEQYLAVGDWQKAERLYATVSGNRKLDWVMLGRAKVEELKGDNEAAKGILEQLIADSRLYLPAYDELVSIHANENDFESLQEELIRVTDLSPKSILRQRKLAQIAEENGDIGRTLKASMEAMKLGEHSCHHNLSDTLLFLSAAGDSIEANLQPEYLDLVEETKKCLTALGSSHKVNIDQNSQAKLSAARVLALEGKLVDAKKMADEDQKQYEGRRSKSIERDLARFAYLNTTNQFAEADTFLEELAEHYRDDPASLEKLDKLLPEPQSDSNRKRVAKLNKQGIDCYQQGQFDEALTFFRRATLLFPRHTGIQLNHLQTLLGKIKLFPDNSELQKELRNQLQRTKALLPTQDHPQYERFSKLRDKADAALRQA